MTKLKMSFGLIGLLIASGCAESAKNVDAAYVSPNVYAGQSCNSLMTERNEIVRRVNNLTKQQNKAATDDAVITGIALVLFWPAAIALAATDDNSSELAVAKGNYDAITSKMQQQGCSLPAPAIEQS